MLFRRSTAVYHFFSPSCGLKKLVNLAILLVFTFFSDSTPRDAAGALRFAPALSAASDLDCVMGAEAAICAAVRLAKYSLSAEKLGRKSARHAAGWGQKEQRRLTYL